tara:strand:- start:230 stop:1126 length:897 start_codon:yes stop_codon:yes gene_type:complete
MGVFLGNIGNIELKRKSLEGSKESQVDISDVNASRNRFSFDFEEGYLITGDLVEITSTDDSNLDFVDPSGWDNNTVQSSGNWYVFVDDLGGIKLYKNFDDSLEGGADGIVSLNAIISAIPIRVTIRDRDSRLLASVTEYELNTNRETVDITVLSDEHRQQYSTLISGSGRLSAEWDYANSSGKEPAHYLMQLILRTEIGSSFHARFYVKSADTEAASGDFAPSQTNDALWWEFDAVVTNSATRFSPGSIIVSSVEFVTTGPVRLKASTQTMPYLLQEDGGKISLEQDASSFLLLEEPD